MNRHNLPALPVLSLIISIYLNFNSATFFNFIIFSLMGWVVIFGILSIAGKSFENLRSMQQSVKTTAKKIAHYISVTWEIGASELLTLIAIFW